MIDTHKIAVGLASLPTEVKGIILDALPPQAYLAMGQVNRDWYDQTHSRFHLRRQMMALPQCCQARARSCALIDKSDTATLTQMVVQSAKLHSCDKNTRKMGDYWRREFDWDVEATQLLHDDCTWDEWLYEATCHRRA